MVVTRHISIDEDHFEKMKAYIEKHNGNLGAALKEMIYRAGKYSKQQAIDCSMFKWMLGEIDGVLVPDSVLDELIDPGLIRSMNRLKEKIEQMSGRLEWDVDINLFYDNEAFPSSVLIEMKGDPVKIKIFAKILSQFLVKNSSEHAPLEIRYVLEFNDRIKLELLRSNRDDARNSLITFFGGIDETKKIINKRPDFWNAIINRHLLSNYNMVTVHRNCFEDLLSDKIPAGEIMIEALAKKPIREIPLRDMLSFIKDVYETSRIVDKVEIENDTIIVSHDYRNEAAIDKIKKCFIALLETNGHLYDARSMANNIIFIHRPDVGIKINEIVESLRSSNSRVDQQLLMFIAYLKGLKEMPDIPVSLAALGRRTGKSLMEEYEKENNIKKWDLKNFQKAIETIDSKLHRESEWTIDGKSLMYTIKRCCIATDGNMFDTYICHNARETFKGAMNYAFGDNARLEIEKLLSHGDELCEVIIKIL